MSGGKLRHAARFCDALARAEAETPAPKGGLAEADWNLPAAEWLAAWAARDRRCAEELEAEGFDALAEPYRLGACRYERQVQRLGRGAGS